jgi:hypothetical protein
MARSESFGGEGAAWPRGRRRHHRCDLATPGSPRCPEGAPPFRPDQTTYRRICDTLARPPKSSRPSSCHRPRGREEPPADRSHRSHRRNACRRHQTRALRRNQPDESLLIRLSPFRGYAGNQIHRAFSGRHGVPLGNTAYEAAGRLTLRQEEAGSELRHDGHN